MNQLFVFWRILPAFVLCWQSYNSHPGIICALKIIGSLVIIVYFLPNYFLRCSSSNPLLKTFHSAWKTVSTLSTFCQLHLSSLFPFTPLPRLYPVIYKYSRCLLWSGLQVVKRELYRWQLMAVTSPLTVPRIGYKLWRLGVYICLGVRVCAYMFESLCVNHACDTQPGLISLPASAPPGPPGPLGAL